MGLLLRLWSELQEPRLLFRGPRLGTKEERSPLLLRGLNADGLASGLLLSPSSLSGGGDGVSSKRSLPFLHSLRALSTASLARGSGGSSDSEGPAKLMACAGDLAGSPLRGVILMVTGLHTALGCRRDQIVRFK